MEISRNRLWAKWNAGPTGETNSREFHPHNHLTPRAFQPVPTLAGRGYALPFHHDRMQENILLEWRNNDP
jgi:hypothetical protein